MPDREPRICILNAPPRRALFNHNTTPKMGSHHQPFSLAILGPGIGGLALSIGLRRQNVQCTIYEAAPKFDAVGAGIGLGPNALKAMELMDPTFAKMYDPIKVGNTSKER